MLGPALQVWGTREEDAAQRLAWAIASWSGSTPARGRGQAGTHEQSYMGQLQTPPHQKKSHAESPLSKPGGLPSP